MAIASISATGQAGAIWAQVQQQQVQRTAQQAAERARALQAQAGDAQAAADRAQENARSLKVQSQQAQGEASNARLDLATMQSAGRLQAQFGELRAQLASALGETTSAATTSAATTGSAQPVVNAQGQTTGTLLSVTA